MPVLQYYVVFMRAKIEEKPDAKTPRITKNVIPLSIYEQTNDWQMMRAGRKCLRVNVLGEHRENVGRV